MNKKGFTLIELLTTLVVITIVFALSFTVITNKITESKEKLYNVLINDIEQAGRKYMLENYNSDKYHLNTLCVNLSTLQEKGYLEKGDIKNPKTKEEMRGSLEIKFNSDKNQYSYTYKETCTEKTVTPVSETIINNEDVKLTGPTDGLYETTDSYIFKGTDPNNHIKFSSSNDDWRIISIDKETNLVKIINLSSTSTSYPEDGIITYLNNDFDSGSTYSDTKELINTNSKWNIGKIDDYKDSALSIKSQEKQSTEFHTIGLLSIGEYIDSSTNKDCYKTNNCSSYLPSDKKYWLLNSTTDNKLWYVDNNELKNETPNNQLYYIYPVLNLKLNTEVTGTGTSLDPYIIKDED